METQKDQIFNRTIFVSYLSRCRCWSSIGLGRWFKKEKQATDSSSLQSIKNGFGWLMTLSVDSTRRRLVGWVQWAAPGCKCTNLRHVESTGGHKKGCCFFCVLSWIMNAYWISNHGKYRSWRISDAKRNSRKQKPNVWLEKSVPATQNLFRVTCPKLIFGHQHLYKY
jgi:hypothetical protein